MGVQARVLDAAATLVASRGIRAFDAVQLACALTARAGDPQVDSFLCFDRGLNDAAAQEGFVLLHR